MHKLQCLVRPIVAHLVKDVCAIKYACLLCWSRLDTANVVGGCPPQVFHQPGELARKSGYHRGTSHLLATLTSAGALVFLGFPRSNQLKAAAANQTLHVFVQLVHILGRKTLRSVQHLPSKMFHYEAL